MSLRGVLLRFAALILLLASLASCGLLVSFSSYDTAPADAAPGAIEAGPLYAVSGIASGLAGAQVTVLLNGAGMMRVGDGPFAFSPALEDGQGYSVTLQGAPPLLSCSVSGGTGTIAGADVPHVAIQCRATDASLASLSLSVAPISPAFAPATATYTAGPIRVTGLLTPPPTTTVTATVRNSGAHILVAGVPVMSGTASAPIALRAGPTPIDVIVTAADGKTQTHYTVVVSGTPSDYIKASNTRAGNQFGAVALSGNTLAVGSPDEGGGATGTNGDQTDGSAPTAGAVYVFTRTGAVWSQQAYIKASNTQQSARFGCFVAVSGDTLAVGSCGERSAATGVNGNQTSLTAIGAGAVYVFTRTGTLWSQQAYVKASNTRSGAEFGTSVALSGDTMAVGSPNESSKATGVAGNQADTSATGAGAVYVFARSGTTWSQQAYIKASKTRAGAYFGNSLAISEDTLAVGSYLETSNATGLNGNQADTSLYNAGATYVFTRSGTTWTQQAYIKASKQWAGHLCAWRGGGLRLYARGHALVAGRIRQSFEHARGHPVRRLHRAHRGHAGRRLARRIERRDGCERGSREQICYELRSCVSFSVTTNCDYNL